MLSFCAVTTIVSIVGDGTEDGGASAAPASVLGNTSAAAMIAGGYKRLRTCATKALIGVVYSIRNVKRARGGSCMALSRH